MSLLYEMHMTLLSRTLIVQLRDQYLEGTVYGTVYQQLMISRLNCSASRHGLGVLLVPTVHVSRHASVPRHCTGTLACSVPVAQQS